MKTQGSRIIAVLAVLAVALFAGPLAGHAQKTSAGKVQKVDRVVWVHNSDDYPHDFEQEIIIDDGSSGWLGVSISEVTSDKAKEAKLPAERGVLVTEVEKDSAAEKAGIRAGDIITDFSGQRVEGTVQFRRLVRETLAGRSVALTVWREGRSQNLTVQMGKRNDMLGGRVSVLREPDIRGFVEPRYSFNLEPSIRVAPRIQLFASGAPRLGISGQDLSGQLGEYFGAPGGEGVLVNEVQKGTPAEKAGMKAGDVITKIDGQRVRNLDELRERMRGAREKASVPVTVLRKGAETGLTVEIEKPDPPRRATITRRVTI